jgi:hypothetical protein
MYAFSPHETMHLQKIIAQVIKLKVQYPEHQIQSIRMDNATEFFSRAFNDYCMALGI